MILSIRAYGDSVLRATCDAIDASFEGLNGLITDMYQTMDASNGVGLAAPQVGEPIRLFIIDSTAMYDTPKEGLRKVFINAEMIEETDKPWAFEEGCLSIPHIRENVERKARIRIKYQDEKFKTHEEVFEGMTARVIQHEYDHIEGILFVDHISPLKRRLLKGKLTDITKGKISIDYRMKFPRK
jgi:peptide deformylase